MSSTTIQSGVPDKKAERRVIVASSLGTVFEWYDFYLYGALLSYISANFFTGVNETARLVFTLLAFAAGFMVRPFGAIVFGRIGDLVGRKYTFLVTILIMGVSTFGVGLLPSYNSIGVAAPIILIVLRLLQGLALGGEYGGAATYVAEHAPHGKRGLHTAFIQTTATLGLFLSLLVVVLIRNSIGADAFKEWGWRLPFLVSIVLLGVSVWIRLKLEESPTFKRMKAEGKGSKAPLTDAFGKWSNMKIVILALIGAVMGQAVVWYAGQFYALFFLTQTLKVDETLANYMIAGALLIGTPGFLFFGWLSDKIGRKWIILAGMALAVVTYFPIFHGLTTNINPALAAAQENTKSVIIADPATCSFQFNPTGTATFTSDCDKAKGALSRASVAYANEVAPAGSPTVIKIGAATIQGFDAAQVSAAIKAAGYPTSADSSKINYFPAMVLLVILVIYVTMVYGPIAALLVELFPTRIRYTSMSLPYHIGNGWFGGLLPTTSFALVALTGDIYYGLWYPIVIAAVCFVIGALFLPETKNNRIDD